MRCGSAEIHTFSEKAIDATVPERNGACRAYADCMDLLRVIPDNSIQFIICDPLYNIRLAGWDAHDDYVGWASRWLREANVCSDSGNLVVFGGLQYQAEAGTGDLLTLMHDMRAHSSMRLV